MVLFLKCTFQPLPVTQNTQKPQLYLRKLADPHGRHDNSLGVGSVGLPHRATVGTSELHRWMSAATRELNVEGHSES